MPDSFVYEIVIRRVKDGGELNAQRARLLEKFPPKSLDNLPIDFIKRCVLDPREEFPGCIVLKYSDGSLPSKEPSAIFGKTYPTYKNMQGKKVAAIGIAPSSIKSGTIIKQICMNIYCVNQQHLEITDTVVNNGRTAAQTYLARKAEGYYDPPSEDA